MVDGDHEPQTPSVTIRADAKLGAEKHLVIAAGEGRDRRGERKVGGTSSDVAGPGGVVIAASITSSHHTAQIGTIQAVRSNMD